MRPARSPVPFPHRRATARRALGSLLLCAGALGAGIGCEPQPPAPEAPPTLQRAIPESPDRTLSADWPRAEIGAETRPVLGARKTWVLRSYEPVELGASVVLDTPLPEALRDEPAAWIGHRLSVRDPSLPSDTLGELRSGDRVELEASTVLSAEAGRLAERTRHTFEIPEALRGRKGLASVVARSLPGEAVQRHRTRVFTVPADGPARLEFGLGIEPTGWEEGFAPVHFRTYVEPVAAASLPRAARGGGTRGAEVPAAAGEAVLVHERRLDPVVDPRERRWFDASVDVSRFAGRRVRFRFEAEALATEGISGPPRSFPVIGNPELVGSPRRRGTAAPNVLLVSLDTLRARSLGLYGHGRDTMPALEARLAARGSWVNQVVAPYAYTPPSHMTMLTGLEPCAHGVVDRHGVLAEDRVSLPELLRAAGYRTAAFTEDAYVVAAAGFARGFDTYVEFRSEEGAAPGFILDAFGAAETWLRERAHAPFFLFVHTYQVHAPFVPPRGYGTLFPEDVDAGQSRRFDDALRRYEQEIRYTDDMLAALLDTLAAEGLAENTLVVVTSDHGESFGEHLVGGHGFTIHDEEILVPLVFRGPGIAAGRALDAQVGLVDLAPTLLDILGLPVPEAMQGRSFAVLLDAAAKPPQTAAWPDPPRTSAATGIDRRGVRTPRYKYIVQVDEEGRRERLFAVDEDPLERTDLSRSDAPESRALLGAARAALATHDGACAEWREAHPLSDTSRLQDEDRPSWFVNRDEIEAKLRSLGYLE